MIPTRPSARVLMMPTVRWLFYPMCVRTMHSQRNTHEGRQDSLRGHELCGERHFCVAYVVNRSEVTLTPFSYHLPNRRKTKTVPQFYRQKDLLRCDEPSNFYRNDLERTGIGVRNVLKTTAYIDSDDVSDHRRPREGYPYVSISIDTHPLLSVATQSSMRARSTSIPRWPSMPQTVAKIRRLE